MRDHITYETTTQEITVEKMQFTILHRRPQYSAEEYKAVKSNIERQLFQVFAKYEKAN